MSCVLERFRGKHVLVTEACTGFGTKLALCLAHHGVEVSCVSSIEKNFMGLKCGSETPGLTELLRNPFHHLPVVNLKTLRAFRDEADVSRPWHAVIVTDPDRGVEQALTNAEIWSQAFTPRLRKTNGILAFTVRASPKDIPLWHTFLKTVYQKSKTIPQHNVVCFGRQPRQISHCNVLPNLEWQTFFKALLAHRPRSRSVSLMKST